MQHATGSYAMLLSTLNCSLEHVNVAFALSRKTLQPGSAQTLPKKHIIVDTTKKSLQNLANPTF